jgi:hypothetical protein
MAYIQRERERYLAAKVLQKSYAKSMLDLGLHPLTQLEIANRLVELNELEDVELGRTMSW